MVKLLLATWYKTVVIFTRKAERYTQAHNISQLEYSTGYSKWTTVLTNPGPSVTSHWCIFHL